MKRVLVTALTAALVVVLGGCSHIIDPVEPSGPPPQHSATVDAAVSIIPLPPSIGTRTLSKRSPDVLVTPTAGGVVAISNAYQSVNGTVSVSMELKFEAGTVTAPTTVAITLDDKQLIADFSPSGSVFTKPALLDADITGLDLSMVPPGATISLYYLNRNVVEKMDASDVRWDAASGTISFSGGKIPHFSIYGFGFTK